MVALSVAITVAAVVAAVQATRSLARTNGAPVGCEVTRNGRTFALTAEQAQNGAIEAAVAYQLGLPDHAVTVALATSLQESGLRNLPYGDADSIGLFQQRPSQGWGTKSQLLDPIFATTAFYQALARVPGWQSMPVTEAAQSVQHSAAPDAYAAWGPEARALAVTLTAEVPAGMSCRLATFRGPPPPAGALNAASNQEFGHNLLGVELPTTTGWRVAIWAEAHASAYHIRRIRFAHEQWTPKSASWETKSPAASHPPTSAVSVTYANN